MTNSGSIFELPSPTETTYFRGLLDRIVSGEEPVPGYVTSMALPRLQSWSPGVAHGQLEAPVSFSVAPRVVFGGYCAAALDQFAAFAAFTVMPSNVVVLTSRLEVEFARPLCPGMATICSRAGNWQDGRTLLVDVAISQGAVVTARAQATQVLAEVRK